METRRAKTTGWAAFGLKQQGQLPIDDDPFPPIPGAAIPPILTKNTLKNHGVHVRPFSSISPAAKSPFPSDNRDFKKPLQAASCSTIVSNGRISDISGYEKVKESFSWAGRSLLDDVLAAVEYDVDKAYASLNAMVFTAHGDEYNSVNNGKINSNEEIKPDSSGEFMDLADVQCIIDSLEKKHSDDSSSSSKLSFARWDAIPIEPEWEEDDVYYIHRKDAMKMMRSASQHSKAAQNAYLREDHVAAQELSLKAKEEWMASKRLNYIAAKEILNFRNRENDLWKIDLHGLHASEAVEALEERLKGIESHHLRLNHSVSLDEISQVASHTKMKKMYELNESSRPKRPTTLQVITGKGSHSRGEAAIPVAIRNFLTDNGYGYDDTRPGMVTVWPKIHRQRRSSTAS